MSQPPYDGPDRRRTVQDRFEEAVEIASTRAAQKVARIHRWRLVRWTFLASMLTAIAIFVTLWLIWIGPQERNFTKSNIIYDCQLFKQASSAMGNFVQTDAQLRYYQAKNNPIQKKLIDDLGKIIPIKDLSASVKNSNTQVFKTIAQWKLDAKVLNNLGGTNCVMRLSN